MQAIASFFLANATFAYSGQSRTEVVQDGLTTIVTEDVSKTWDELRAEGAMADDYLVKLGSTFLYASGEELDEQLAIIDSRRRQQKYLDDADFSLTSQAQIDIVKCREETIGGSDCEN